MKKIILTYFFPLLINRNYPWCKFNDKYLLDFATSIYTLKDEGFKKQQKVVVGYQSGGGHFVGNVVILALSKSFGRLLDEIIALMMVNDLIMWNNTKLKLAFENRREQERHWTRNPYHVSITSTW